MWTGLCFIERSLVHCAREGQGGAAAAGTPGQGAAAVQSSAGRLRHGSSGLGGGRTNYWPIELVIAICHTVCVSVLLLGRAVGPG